MSEPSYSLTLLLDLYELTMAYGYWKLGMAEREAVFQLTYRKGPFGGPYAIAAGLETLIQCLRDFQFDDSDIAYLRTLKNAEGGSLFEGDFLQEMCTLRLSCDLDAMPEGTVVFPKEPLVRVQGPLLQVQILESIILNVINFQTLIATKARRVTRAADPQPVIEFGMRRAQGIDGALSASRAAFIGGCESTSNTLAGKLFDIPVRGTHAHSWVMAFDSEKESFEAYARVMPDNCILLVDTYNTLQGVRNAIAVGHALRQEGKRLLGIRLDSGDLTTLSLQSRQLLDEAGFTDTIILASNELDENVISDCKQKGAAIDTWGVGTRLVTGREQPALDGVYKLSAIRDASGQWHDKAKKTDEKEKVSDPGILQVRRYNQNGKAIADVLYDTRYGITEPCEAFDVADEQRLLPANLQGQDLLAPIMRGGKIVYHFPTLREIQTHMRRETQALPVEAGKTYYVGREAALQGLKDHFRG
jgi:nicotinate phosphoribosyltransferase